MPNLYHYYTKEHGLRIKEMFLPNKDIYKWHKETGPAFITYNQNTGNIMELEWYIKNEKHRKDKPAYMAYYHTTGDIKYKIYLIESYHHNELGPALIEYTYNGDILRSEWFLNGSLVAKSHDFYISYIKKYEPQIYAKILKKESVNLFD